MAAGPVVADNLNWVQDIVQATLSSPRTLAFVELVHDVYRALGIKEPYPSPAECLVSIIAPLATLFMYFVFFGNRHRRRRLRLQSELERAQAKVAALQDRVDEAELKEEQARDRKRRSNSMDEPEVRVWMDGAFDLLHFGHMNAFRQGRALGTKLIVGVNSDESIEACKGTRPVMNDAERLEAVAACKFVDEVQPNCPYVMNDDYLERVVLGELRCDYVVHGDDPCIVDGKDVYQSAIDRGKYRTIPRTNGVSTTDIVGRMLLLTKEHHQRSSGANGSSGELVSEAEFSGARMSKFLTTSRMLRLFSSGVQAPPEGARVVYVDGAFDMFSCGHIQFLKKARALGDYLICGVFSDQVVNDQRGSNHPIMNLNERVLSVLGCTHVDDVLIDAPWEITRDLVAHLNVAVVAHGTCSDGGAGAAAPDDDGSYRVPKELGIFTTIESTSTLNVSEIAGRIFRNEEMFRSKVAKKSRVEAEFWEAKHSGQ